MELTNDKTTWNNDFREEVKWVRDHWRECWFYPPLNDSLELLPSRDIILKVDQVLKLRIQHLLNQLSICSWHKEIIQMELKLYLEFYYIWDLVSKATDNVNYWPYSRRKSLFRLRQLIGPEQYYSANWWP